MTALFTLIGLFVILFLLSRIVSRGISGFFLHVTKSQKVAVTLLSLIFLPGTVVHETAHFLAAQILFVRSGNMNLVPKLDGDSVRLGSVAIEKTDPVRRMFIGIAPFILGSLILTAILIFVARQNYPLLSLPHLLTIYIVFQIGNTMFSSRRDLEGVIEFIIAIIFIGIVLYFIGLRLPDDFYRFLESSKMETIYHNGILLIAVPIAIDICLILFLWILSRLTR